MIDRDLILYNPTSSQRELALIQSEHGEVCYFKTDRIGMTLFKPIFFVGVYDKLKVFSPVLGSLSNLVGN